MAEVKWIKICTDIFDDEKIMLIESMPDADSLIVIWFKLLCLAGKNNNDGVFLLNDRIAYSDEMLATIFRRNINTVRLALKTFSDFGMIEMIDNVITIPNWNKHQDLKKIQARQEYMRNYMRKIREEQKRLICADYELVNANVNTDVEANVNANVNVNNEVNVNDNVNANVNVNNNANVNNELANCKQGCELNCKHDVNCADKDIDLDLEEYKKYNKYKKDIDDDDATGSESSSSFPDYVTGIIDEWNTLTDIGIRPIKAINKERDWKLYANIKRFGRKSFTVCVENIRKSDYLQGKTSSRKYPIGFDWLITDGNYEKVYEGFYDRYEPVPQSKVKNFAWAGADNNDPDMFSELEEKLLDN